MKIFLLIFLCCISIDTYAAAYYGRNFNVTGTNDLGDEISGTIQSNNGDPYLRGIIFDANGDPHAFEGRWSGFGQITGATEENDSVNLYTYQ